MSNHFAGVSHFSQHFDQTCMTSDDYIFHDVSFCAKRFETNQTAATNRHRGNRRDNRPSHKRSGRANNRAAKDADAAGSNEFEMLWQALHFTSLVSRWA